MSNTIVCGVNWGDEGKGRMIDYLAQDADIVVRFQGGNNAGHTVVNEFGTFKMHLIPSGIFNPKTINILGPGTVVDIEAVIDELDGLSKSGIDVSKYYISDRAVICFPFHRYFDEWEEERLKHDSFGSTKRGIAPAYSDRHLKKSIQIGELLYPEKLRERIEKLLEYENLIAEKIYGKKPFKVDEILEWLLKFGDKIKGSIIDTVSFFEKDNNKNKNILLEAQLGSLRDVYYGIYPFTSSSHVLSSFASIGSGLFGKAPDKVLGVMKAFSTCVGAGPFVTEMQDNIANSLREIAFEYGAATGRPRRIGHFDAFASKFGILVQNATEIALTKLDCLSGQKELLICTEYLYKGTSLATFPITSVLYDVQPKYITMPGWEEDITNCRKFSDLPLNAQNYVTLIQKLTECKISYVSVGAERDQLIVID